MTYKVDIETMSFAGPVTLDLERTGDEFGDLILTVTDDMDRSLKLRLGSMYEDAAELTSQLHKALEQSQDICNHWKDRPHEWDGFYGPVWGDGYNVTLDAQHVASVGDRDAALLRLIVECERNGYFPNLWYEDERGWQEDVSPEKMRAVLATAIAEHHQDVESSDREDVAEPSLLEAAGVSLEEAERALANVTIAPATPMPQGE